MAGLNGIQPNDGGWSKGYTDYSKAKFTSKLTIYEEDGTPLVNDSIEDGSPYWDFVPMGSLIKYKVDTRKSDRVQLQLIYFDTEKLMVAMEEEMNALSPAQIQEIENGNEKIMEDMFVNATNRYGGMEAFFVTIWSDVFDTNSAGIATGQIRLQKEWPKTTYMFMAHYGYDADAESDKTLGVAWEWAQIAVFVAASAVAFVATGGLSTAATIALWATFGLDMIALGKAGLARKFGLATINKHDQRLPLYGFNHTYMFNTMPLDEEMSDDTDSMFTLSDDNIKILQNLTTIKDIKGLAAIGGGIILLLAILKLRGD